MKRLADCPTPLWLMPPVFVVAVALNYPWEPGQGSFYEGVTGLVAVGGGSTTGLAKAIALGSDCR